MNPLEIAQALGIVFSHPAANHMACTFESSEDIDAFIELCNEQCLVAWITVDLMWDDSYTVDWRLQS